ncbi:hypothetical protein HDU79_010007 [Rhizoclosmatium sp. JEL0117]|nr:hypothetical protein HDU79_010007 [Rhizoclosmatium sp. JEL0117]
MLENEILIEVDVASGACATSEEAIAEARRKSSTFQSTSPQAALRITRDSVVHVAEHGIFVLQVSGINDVAGHEEIWSLQLASAIRNDDESSKDVEANDVGLTGPHKDNEGAPNKLLSESTALLSNEYRANQTQPSIPQPKYMQMGANGAISASKLIPLNPEGKEQSDNQRYEDGQPYIRGDESSSTNNHHTTARALENVGNENQQVNPFWLSSHPNNSVPSSRPTKISQATYPIHAGPYSHPTSGAPASQSTNITPAPHPTNVAPASHPGNVPPTSHPINVAPESYQIHARPYSHLTNVKPYLHPTNSVPSSCPTNVAPEFYPIHVGPSSYPTNVAPALYQNQPLYQHHVWQQSPQMWPPLHPTYTWLPSNQNPYYSVPMGANWGYSSQQYLQAPNANTAIGFRNAESLTFNQQPQTYQVTAQAKPSQYENNSSNQIQKAVSELARAFQMFEAKMLSISNVDVPVNFIPRSSSLSMQGVEENGGGVEESGGVLESGDVSAQPILQPVHTRFWHEEISKLAIHWEKSKGVRVGNLFEIKYEGLYSSKAHPMSNPFTVAFRSDVTKVEMDKAIAANVNAIDIRLNCNGSTDHCTANMKGITGIISARSKCPECQQNSSAPACVNCKRDTRRRCTFALVAVVKAKDLTQVVTIFQHPHRMSSGSDYKRQGIAPIITEFVRALQEPTMGRVRSFGAVANRFRSFPEHVLASPKDVKRVETQTMKRMKAIGESDPFEALVALQREYPEEFRILQNLPENGKPSKKGPFHGIFMSDENILSWLMTPEVIGIDSMFNVNENGAPVTILTSTHSTTNHSYPAAVLLSSCVTEEMYTLFLKAAVANVEEYAKKAVSNGCMPDGHETKVQGGMEYMKEVCREGFSRRVLVVKQDFSIALRNAVRAVFPDAIISGCLVHLCRIIESEMTSEKVHGTNDDLCKVLGKLGKWLSPEEPVHTRFWHEEISKLAIHWEKSKGVRVGNLFEIKYEGLYSSKAHPMSNPFTVAFRSDVTKVEMDKAIAANVNAIDIRLNCNGSTDHCTANMKGITGIISARSKCPECQQNSSAPACVNCKRDTRRRCTFALVAVVKAKDLTQVVTIFQHPHRMSSGSDYKRQGIAPIITEFVRALQEPTMGRVRSFGAVANRFRSFPEHVLASPKDVKRVETQTMKRMKAIGESDPFEALVALQREYPGEFRILQNLPENGKPSKKGPFHGIFMSDENILSWLMTPEVIGIDSMFNVNENGAPVTILTSTHSTTNHSYPAAVLLSSCVTEEMYTLFLKAAVANVEEYAKKAVSNGCMPDGHETKVQGGMEYMKEVCREGFSRRVLVVKQDFSIALRNAVRAVFPDAIISGCLVHLCRIIESEMTSEKVHGTNDDLCKVLGKLGKWLSPEVYDFISKQLSEVAEEKADISASVRVGVNIPAKRKRNGEIHLSYSKDFRADLYYHIQFVLRSTSREHSRSLWNEFFLKMYPLIQKHYEQLPTIDQKRQAAALILYFASGLADPEGWGGKETQD